MQPTTNLAKRWQVVPGTVLVYEPNTDFEEAVVVRPGPTGGLVADFTKAHPPNCTVINRGNPGPWARYDPRQDSAVVPYFAIIE